MHNQETLQLRDREAPPDFEALQSVLREESYAAYELLQDALPGMEIEQSWQWYTPHKAWFARGQHVFVSPRGAKKEKTLYWLHVYDGYFCVAVWFKEKNRAALLEADLSDETKHLITNGETMGNLPTFPVVVDVNTPAALTALYALIDCKKRLEPA